MEDGETTRLRFLGEFEAFRTRLHDLGLHYSVTVQATYSMIALSFSDVHSTIYRALKDTMQAHPALRVRIEGRKTPLPYFVPAQDFELYKLVTFRKSKLGYDDLRHSAAILSEEAGRAFDDNLRPLWRLLVDIRGTFEEEREVDVYFTYHHAIGDGKSGLAFHRTFLRALNQGEGRRSPTNPLVDVPTTLQPSLEELLAYSVGTSSANDLPVVDGMSLQKTPTLDRWTASPFHAEKTIQTKTRLIMLPDQSVRALVAACRQHNTTMTPFLEVLLGKTLFNVFPQAQELRCDIAVCLRRFFPKTAHIGEQSMGLWVDAFIQDFRRSDFVTEDDRDFPWTQVEWSAMKLKLELDKRAHDFRIRGYRFEQAADLVRKIGQKRSNSYSISNLGVFDIDSGFESPRVCSGPWHIKRVTLSQSAHVLGSALQVSVVTLKGGVMSLAISYQKDTVSEGEMDIIAGTLEAQLMDLGRK